jgi:two-component system, NtrC family, sensor kinase
MGTAAPRERILLVDDESPLLTALDDVLGDQFDVVSTTQPLRALELAKSDPELAVVISDHFMPGINGDELFGQLRQVSSASRVLLTGCTDLHVVLRAVNDGNIFAFVTKPWSPEELRMKVRNAAQQFRLRRELELEVGERMRTAEALRVSEERLRLAFQASNAGLFDWNVATGEVIYSATPATPASLRGSVASMEERVHPDDLARLREAVRVHLELRQPFEKLELRALTPDGGYRWLELNAQAAWDEQGRPLRLVGSAMDVDDLRQARARLAQAQKLEGIGQLAAGIAHEINTPTQYVTDNVAFLERAFGKLRAVLEAQQAVVAAARSGQDASAALDELDGVQRQSKLDYVMTQAPRALQQSLEGLARVTSIVKAMKEFSHPHGGERQLVDIHEIIESSCAVAKNEWKYVAQLELDFDHQLGPVPVLRNELSQVILNLVVNAAHAIAAVHPSGAEQGRIKISTRNLDSAVEIRVADTGAGIPEAVRSRIFEPFFTTKAVGQGTGQGLAISYSVVVDKHQGSIDFETEPGRGTTFIIRLPRVAS